MLKVNRGNLPYHHDRLIQQRRYFLQITLNSSLRQFSLCAFDAHFHRRELIPFYRIRISTYSPRKSP